MVSGPRDARFDPVLNFRSASGQRDYPEHRAYVGDTCVLRADAQKVGLVTQTHADVDSHYDAPLMEDDEIVHFTVDKHLYDQYVASGIPPSGTVLVSWLSTQTAGLGRARDHELLPESAIECTDRELCIGDVVKLNPEDAVSGSVVDTHVRANLREPQRWPPPTSSTQATGGEPSRTIFDVDVADLCDSLEVNSDRMIYYKGWIGRVVDYYEHVKVRLSDGSIIELEDAEDVTTVDGNPVTDTLVGDLIKTKKANLRRGRAIYGQYNPNVTPIGYVAEVTIASADIDWLQPKPAVTANESLPAMPPSQLERHELEEALIYGVSQSSGQALKRKSMEGGAGDKVRLRDPASMVCQREIESCWIPRQSTLGFDINVFTIRSTLTTVEVLWQDGTTTQHPSIAVVPIMDFDDDDDAWPGELITTRAAKTENGVRTPDRVGIVQSVRARDRMASVRWFDGTVSFFETEDHSLMPGSWTGTLNEECEDVSLYDIWTEPGLPRRLGDFLAVVPPFGSEHRESAAWKQEPQYKDVKQCLEQSSHNQDWFGEVIELGTDGLLKLHLGGSKQPRDARIPWECTLMAYSTDLDDSEDEDESLEEDEVAHAALPHVSMGLPNTTSAEARWTDEQGHALDTAQVDGEEWSTDDDEQDEPMTDASELGSDIDTPRRFSFQTMLDTLSQDHDPDCRLDNFKVLEGEPPADHHFKTHAAAHLSGQNLRRIQKEHKILRSSLPPEVFVRTWDAALHLLRVLILGPLETPYEYAPFVIDVLLDQTFPSQPPQMFFHSWTDGSGPVNPNLYEDGKICLSLLGTWPGNDKNDTWSSKATVLQVLVSLLGLVLVKDPYYNEAGFEVRAGSRETKIPAAMYAERSFLKTRQFILRALEPAIPGFEHELRVLYLHVGSGKPMLLARAIYDAVVVIRQAQGQAQGLSRPLEVDSAGKHRIMSAGAVIPLQRTVRALLVAMRQSPAACITSDRLIEIFDQISPHDEIPPFENLFHASNSAPSELLAS